MQLLHARSARALADVMPSHERPHRPRLPRGKWTALALAIFVNLIFLVVLIFSVSWRRSEPVPVSAELYAPPAKTPVAEPPPPEVKPPPLPEPKPEPRPEPKPEPKPVPPPPPPPQAPDIALKAKAEAERKRKEEAERKEAEAKKQEEKKQAELRERQQREVAAMRAQAERETQSRVQAEREAQMRAQAIAQERGLTWVHPYDDPLVIAGQGTIALEMLEEVSDSYRARLAAEGKLDQTPEEIFAELRAVREEVANELFPD